MVDQSRRRFIRNAGLGLVGTGLGIGLPRVGSSFGGLPTPSPESWTDPGFTSPYADMCIPFAGQKKRVLEIVLHGGLSPWETFWVSEAGSGEGDFFTSLASDGTGSEVLVDMKGAESLVKEFSWCDMASGVTPMAPPDPGVVKEFGVDDEGNKIYWGPATAPLWSDEILSHARVTTFFQENPPHELCMPTALTGLRLGDPRAAGLGAALSRAFIDENGPGDRPYSYVLMPQNLGVYRGIVSSIFATGTHGGANRPVELPVGTTGLGNLFLESQPSNIKQAALEALREQYRARLHWAGDAGDSFEVPSPQFNDYRFSAVGLENASALHELVGNDALKADPGGACIAGESDEASLYTGTNFTAKSLEVAATLLDPNQGDARYVGLMDSGFRHASLAPYDTHNQNKDLHIPVTQSNLFNCLSHLRSLIDTGKIDLCETLVVLTTEMGRTPNLGEAGKGREHWPYGTVQVLLGSPGESGIAGSISGGGVATAQGGSSPYTPAHARAAVLKAAGVNPVANGFFQKSEIAKVLFPEGGEYDEQEISSQVGETFLGLPKGA